MPRGQRNQQNGEDGRRSPAAEEEKEDAAKIHDNGAIPADDGAIPTDDDAIPAGNGRRERDGDNLDRRNVRSNLGPLPPE